MSLDISLEKLRARRGAKWSNYDPDVIPAFVADMDFPIAEPIKQAVADVIEREDVGYPGAATLDAMGEAFATRMRTRYGWSPDPAGVFSLSDLIQSLRTCVEMFCRPGGGVVVQTPIYHPFLDVVADFDRRLIDNRLLRSNHRFEIDFDHLRDSIDGDTDLFLFCNPHNPSGRVFERAELEQIAQVVVEHDLIVVADEIHADLTYPGHSHIPLASLGPEIAARTITLTSATKAFNIAGMKYALMHFGDLELLAAHTERYHPRLLGVPNIFGMVATLAAWQDCDEWLRAVVAQLDENRQAIQRFVIEREPRIRFNLPQAGYLAWLDCSDIDLPSAPFDYFLAEARVALSDGREFSSYSEDCVRLNFATTPRVLEDIFDRLATSLANR